MIKKLDLILLNKVFQKTSNWIQDWTRYNCFFIARRCLYIFAVSAMYLLYLLHDTPGFEAMFPPAAMCFLMYGVTLDMVLIRYETTQHSGQGFMNPAAHKLTPTRHSSLYLLVILTFCAVFFYNFKGAETEMDIRLAGFNKLRIWMVIVELFASFTLYFVSCTPRPPGPSKLKEALHNLKGMHFGPKLAGT